MSTDTPLARVQTAMAPGTAGPSQDRVFTGHNAVVVLDGASSPEPGSRDGAWMADTLGRNLVALLDKLPDVDLSDALHQTLTTVRDRYGLAERNSPSTTVSVVRWTVEYVDALVLGDSPVLVRLHSGEPVALVDDRLARLPRRAEFISVPRNQAGVDERWRALVRYERSERNRAGGYWIAEASPEAARHALTGQWGRAEVTHAMALTDGIANCVTMFRALPDWRAILAVASRDLAELISVAEGAEDADPNRQRWPRHKHRDDKAAALVTFGRPLLSGLAKSD